MASPRPDEGRGDVLLKMVTGLFGRLQRRVDCGGQWVSGRGQWDACRGSRVNWVGGVVGAGSAGDGQQGGKGNG